MEITKCILTNNDCYKANKRMTPIGIVVHSTGANNTNICRYVQPDDGLIGKNKYNNDWNRSGVSKCVHAFIGTDRTGNVVCYQTLPWNMRCWGCGSGSNGSFNNGYIQFEICEDSLTDYDYFMKVFSLAIDLCKFLMQEYNIKVEDVVSHKEAHDLGYGSNHGDCDYWLKKFGKDMDWFRSQLVTKPTFKAHRIDGEWGNGKVGSVIDAVTMKVAEGTITYRAHRVDGVWGGEKTGYSTTKASDRAGKIGIAVDAVAIKAIGISGKLRYRVHRSTDNKWGSWITGYSTTNYSQYAGSFGKPIDGIEVVID